MSMGCPECGSLITGEHRGECAGGQEEELRMLRLFYALMRERADPIAKTRHAHYAGAVFSNNFRQCAAEASLIRSPERDFHPYHPDVHSQTWLGGRALEKGRSYRTPQFWGEKS